MIARGHLEIRVAFRIHKETGNPLPFQSGLDGYVHEKWGLFFDGEGNRLYVSGSLNESRTALVQNAENIDVHADWWNAIERQRADDAGMAFEGLWNNKNPHLRVLSLPEAVKQKLIKIGQAVCLPLEIDESTAYKPEVEPPSALERLRFTLIKNGPKLPGGRFVGIETVPIEPWPHQEVVARRLIETWPYNYLLCDEVGLGKTIEAGLAIRSLYLSGLVKRVLIAPPAALTRQWQREMAAKFFMPFARAMRGTSVKHEYLHPIEETRPAKNLFEPDLSIVSTGLLTRKERKGDILAAQEMGVALIDEAHYARRKNPRDGHRTEPNFGNLYKTIRDNLKGKTKCLWMATATPMQLDWIEVFDLVSLAGRVGAFRYDPSLMWAYYEVLGNLVRGSSIPPLHWDFLRRAISSLKYQDPFLIQFIQEAVLDARIKKATQRWLDQGVIPKGTDQKNIQKVIFSASPLSRVMLRHTRPLLEVYRAKGKLKENLARREILPVPRIVFNDQERRAYDELESYFQELMKRVNASKKSDAIIFLGFYLIFLRLRFASSLYAIRETLRRSREKIYHALSHFKEIEEETMDAETIAEAISEGMEDDESLPMMLKHRTKEDLEWEKNRLSEILSILEDISQTPSKTQHLLTILNQRKLSGGRLKQTVIFTRFYDTLQDIVRRLRSIDGSLLIGTYSGKGAQYVDPTTKRFKGAERDEIKHRFLRGDIDLLICTDAAAEGLNLQTADLLINYDLPWNPMKVEQRIGRIDRIGQKHDQIFVQNLFYIDSAEQIVYDRLLKRLTDAGYIVGTQQISMLPVTLKEFSELASGSLSIDKLESKAREKIKLQKERTAAMEIPAEDLFHIYTRMKGQKSEIPLPITLENIWDALLSSKYLRDLGCTVSTDEDQKYIVLRGIRGIPDGTALTIDRNLYDKGLPGRRETLHFATYGDPAFEAVLESFACLGLPECVREIGEKIPGGDAEVLSYVVSCAGEQGEKTFRLISSLHDIENLPLNESAIIPEENITNLKKKLRDRVSIEFGPTASIELLEKNNERAAIAQELLNLSILKSLLHPLKAKDHDDFWAIMKNVDEIITEKDQLMIPDMPLSILKVIKDDILFKVLIPELGQSATPTMPILTVKTAVDTGYRVADSLKVKKSELTVSLVESRVDRRQIELLKKIK